MSEKAIEIIYRNCFVLGPSESVLIIIDPHYQDLGKLFLDCASKLTTGKTTLHEIPEGKVNGEEPPQTAAGEMLEHDVTVFLTKKSLTHTDARKEASGKGARIASMPCVTKEMLERCIDIDYDAMNVLSNKLADALDSGKELHLVKDDGTDFRFSLQGMLAHGRHGGLFRKKGEYGNLPDGEAFIAPKEGTANGTFVIDGSIAGIGLVDKPVRVEVQDGFVTGITGGNAADKLRETLAAVGKLAHNIAEFGIGTNPKAIITGNMLEDEKVMGTIHIAFGNNTGFGGTTAVPLHIDCLVRKPTFSVDGAVIMEKGVFSDKI